MHISLTHLYTHLFTTQYFTRSNYKENSKKKNQENQENQENALPISTIARVSGEEEDRSECELDNENWIWDHKTTGVSNFIVNALQLSYLDLPMFTSSL